MHFRSFLVFVHGPDRVTVHIPSQTPPPPPSISKVDAIKQVGWTTAIEIRKSGFVQEFDTGLMLDRQCRRWANISLISLMLTRSSIHTTSHSAGPTLKQRCWYLKVVMKRKYLFWHQKGMVSGINNLLIQNKVNCCF